MSFIFNETLWANADCESPIYRAHDFETDKQIRTWFPQIRTWKMDSVLRAWRAFCKDIIETPADASVMSMWSEIEKKTFMSYLFLTQVNPDESLKNDDLHWDKMIRYALAEPWANSSVFADTDINSRPLNSRGILCHF